MGGCRTWLSGHDCAYCTAPERCVHAARHRHQGEELPTVTVTGQHRRTHSASTESHPHQTPAAQQQPLPSIKAKGGKVSPDLSGPDFISTGVYHTALSPASIRERLESAGTEASAGAHFFRGQRSNTASGDGGAGTWGMEDRTPGAGSGGGFAAGRVQLDVGFENLGLKLKSCGKMVLQGVTGCLKHGRLTAVMGPSGECVKSGDPHVGRGLLRC